MYDNPHLESHHDDHPGPSLVHSEAVPYRSAATDPIIPSPESHRSPQPGFFQNARNLDVSHGIFNDVEGNQVMREYRQPLTIAYPMVTY